MKKYKFHLSILLATVGIRILYCFREGLHGAGDTPFYISQAEAFIDSPLLFVRSNVFRLYYIGYPAFLSIFIRLFEYNRLCIVYAQMAISLLSAVFIYKSIVLLYSEKTISIQGAIIYLGWWEIFRWDNYILSDSLGISIATALLYLFIKTIIERRTRSYIFLIMISIVLSMVRPSAIIITLATLLMVAFYSRNRIRSVSIFLVTIVIIIILFAITGSNRTHSLSNRWYYYTKLFHDGMIVPGGGKLDIKITMDFTTPLATIYSVIKWFIYRVLLLWSPFYYYQSTLHKVFNSITLLPTYFLMVFGLLDLKVKKPKIFVAFAAILTVFTIIQSLTEVDFDNRYRIQAFPYVIILATIGLNSVARRIYDKFCANFAYPIATK